MVKILCFTARGVGTIPGQGSKIPHATQHGQRKKTVLSLVWRVYPSTCWESSSPPHPQAECCGSPRESLTETGGPTRWEDPLLDPWLDTSWVAKHAVCSGAPMGGELAEPS